MVRVLKEVWEILRDAGSVGVTCTDDDNFYVAEINLGDVYPFAGIEESRVKERYLPIGLAKRIPDSFFKEVTP